MHNLPDFSSIIFLFPLLILSERMDIIINLKISYIILKQFAILTILDFKSFNRIKIWHGHRPLPRFVSFPLN